MLIDKILVDEELIKKLKKRFKTKKIIKGMTIHNSYSKCNELTLVIKGELKVLKYNIDGKEQLISSLNKNELFGGPLVFSEGNYPADVIASKDTEIIEIYKKDILELFHEEKFVIFFLKELGNRILNLSQTIDYLSENSIELRILKYLKNQCLKKNFETIYLDINKTLIAKEIGSVREVVSRNFKKLENKGIIKILSNKKIEIIKKEYF